MLGTIYFAYILIKSSHFSKLAPLSFTLFIDVSYTFKIAKSFYCHIVHSILGSPYSEVIFFLYTLRLTLQAKKLYELIKCKVSYTYHYSIMPKKNPKNLCSLSPKLLTTTDLFTISMVLSFPECLMSTYYVSFQTGFLLFIICI